nr:hypothetical protein [Tanacetum cinerariifolium]
MTSLTSLCEMACQLVQKKQEEKQIKEEQAAKAQTWKLSVCYDDDDDEEGYNSLNDNIISELPPYSASCVENLVPNPSESEGKNKCDVPAGFTAFSNVLFDDDYDSDSSDDQSLSDEDVPEKIYSKPLFDEEIIPMEIDQHSFNVESDLIESMPNHDSSIIISSKINSLFDKFAGELTLLTSIPPGIDETDCHPEKEILFAKRLLYDNSSPRPPKEIISDNSNVDIESFSPSPIPNKDSDSHMEEIDLSFNPDDPMPPGIEDDDYDSGRDISILKELLDNYSLSIPANESYHFDIPSPYRPPAKPPDGNTGTLNIKMMGNVSDQKVPIPGLMITRVSNQEKSPDLLSHQGLEAFQPSAECPMIINGKNYEAFSFYDDHIEEIRSGSTTTQSDISLPEYDSFIFDLSNDQFPPTDRSAFTHEEFGNEPGHIISPPEYDCFDFRNLPDPGELISSLNSGIRENLSSTTCVNLPVEDDYSPLMVYVLWIFLAYLMYPVIPPYLHSFGNEDTIFDPGITINRSYSFKPGLSHRCGTFKEFNTHRSHLNESPMEMLFSTLFPMDQ